MRTTAIILFLIIGFVSARAVEKVYNYRQEKPDVQFPALLLLEGKMESIRNQNPSKIQEPDIPEDQKIQIKIQDRMQDSDSSEDKKDLLEELLGGKIRVRRRKGIRRRKSKNRRRRPKYKHGFEMIIFG